MLGQRDDRNRVGVDRFQVLRYLWPPVRRMMKYFLPCSIEWRLAKSMGLVDFWCLLSANICHSLEKMKKERGGEESKTEGEGKRGNERAGTASSLPHLRSQAQIQVGAVPGVPTGHGEPFVTEIA